MCLVGEKLDPECLPPIESTDLLSFLVLETSFYTLKQFKAYKSLDSYNYMVSGFITSVQGKAMGNNFVVVGKVRHSQRMNDTPVPIWIIANNEGTVLSAHCLACKAGLAECCSHIGSVLFLHRSMEPHTRKVSLYASKVHMVASNLRKRSAVL